MVYAIFILILVLLILYGLLPWYQALKFIRYPIRSLPDDLEERIQHHEFSRGWSESSYQKVEIVTANGVIQIWFQNLGFSRSVLFLHGAGTGWISLVKHRDFFVSLGFNPVYFEIKGLRDRRFYKHTFGWNESNDVQQVRNELEKSHGFPTEWGLLGESMGASVGFLSLEKNHWLWMISDSGFSSLKEVFVDLARRNPFGGALWIRFPGILSLVRFWVKLAAGYDPWLIQPHATYQRLQRPPPVLLLHGTEDRYVSSSHSQNFCHRFGDTGIVRLGMIPGARHTKGWRVNRELYQSYILSFLEEVHGARN